MEDGHPPVQSGGDARLSTDKGSEEDSARAKSAEYASMDPSSQNGVVIAFREVTYRFSTGTELLNNLNLQVHRGETLVLLGRSGSGKTTTLKLINDLVSPTSGEVQVEGRPTTKWDPIRLRRGIGYVIQDAGLFPHFSVERNISLVPTIEQWPADRIRRRVAELLQLVGLDSSLSTRYPRELSGGQRQRVGVARALAADPPILLMDEPFAALDPITRAELQQEFLSLQKRLQKTVVFVTHDLREALLLGTRIALMESGRLVTALPPDEFVKSSDPLVKQYLNAFGASNGKRGSA
jgi:osmoprotectant transport system ATP-binding protein